MTLLLSTLALAYTAFCVWLIVRIVNRRERWAKWMLGLAVGLPVLYVGSFGPACWVTASHSSLDSSVESAPLGMSFYWPIGCILLDPDDSVLCDVLQFWLMFGMPSGYCVYVPAGDSLITICKP